MKAWLRYWFPKRRPARLPGGLRGPYDPRTASRDALLLMASLHAKTPQQAARVLDADGRPAADIARERRKTPRRWRYKLKMLIWRIVGHWQPRVPRSVARIGIRYWYRDGS